MLWCTNTAEKAIILARSPHPGSPRIRHAGTDGEAAVDVNLGLSQLQTSAKPSFGEHPSSEFVVLKPHEVHRCEMEIRLPVRRRASQAAGGLIVEGTESQIQVPVLWWWPFYQLTEQETRDLIVQWRGHGELIVGNSLTSWVSLRVPEI